MGLIGVDDLGKSTSLEITSSACGHLSQIRFDLDGREDDIGEPVLLDHVDVVTSGVSALRSWQWKVHTGDTQYDQ
jgi:hypothetical protein